MKRFLNTIAAAAVATTGMFAATPSHAQASDPFIGQLMTVGFNFCPRGWAAADGQLIAISSNTALFSLLGTTFGGDGRTTFGLPDLRGRIAKHYGNGPGLASVRWGQKGGRENVTLNILNMPSHNHSAVSTLSATDDDANSDDPTGASLATTSTSNFSNSAPNTPMANGSVTTAIGQSGGNQSFNIENPYLGVLHCISLFGIFPSRS